MLRINSGNPFSFGSPPPTELPVRPQLAAASTQLKLCDATRRLLANDASLTALSLHEAIDAAGARGLAEALKQNSNLTMLNLRGCQLGASGVQALADALNLNSSLTSLDLSSNQLGDTGVQAVALALELSSSLTLLNLSDIQLGDRGLQALADALELNTSLTTLQLGLTTLGRLVFSRGEPIIRASTHTAITTALVRNRQAATERAKSLCQQAQQCLGTLDVQQAVALCQQALRLDIKAEDSQPIQAVLVQAQQALRKADALTRRGQAQLQAQHYREAQTAFEQALAVCRDHPTAPKGLQTAQTDMLGAAKPVAVTSPSPAPIVQPEPSPPDIAIQAYATFLKDVKQCNIVRQRNPNCFISYAWETDGPANQQLQAFLKRLQADLQKLGATVCLDITHLGGDIEDYMAKEVAQSDRILLIGTPRLFARAAEHNQPGSKPNNLQTELAHIRARVQQQPDCLIPLLYAGEADSALPADIATRHGWLDFRDLTQYPQRMVLPDQHTGLIPRLFGSVYDDAYRQDTKVFRRTLALEKPSPAAKIDHAFQQFLSKTQQMFAGRGARPSTCYLSCAKDEPPAVLARIDRLQQDLRTLGHTVWREDQPREPQHSAERADFVLLIGTPRWKAQADRPGSPVAQASARQIAKRVPLLFEGSYATVFSADLRQLLIRDFQVAAEPASYYRNMAKMDAPLGLIPFLYGMPHKDKQELELDKAYDHLFRGLDSALQSVKS